MNHFNKILKPLIVVAILIVTNCVCAQSYNSSSKKAIKYFEKARQEFLNKNYDNAMSDVKKALQIDDKFTDAYLLEAELYLELDEDSLAIKSYENIFEIDSMSFPKSAIALSKLYSKCFQFDKSIKLLDWYLSLDNQGDDLKKLAEYQLDVTEFRKYLVENPIDYNPRNIGNVNTCSDEYVNQYYVNEDKIIFTKRYNSESEDNPYFEENVFETMKYDDVWSMPSFLFDNLSNIGAANVSADGNEIYFSGCGWENGSGSCDIYCVKFKNGYWSKPINLKSVNTFEWESQPCVSYDGKELYFVRGNKKTGNSDVYVSKRDDKGNWQSATRLNSNVNTEGNEMAPFIHYDGRTLYFSSDNHLGMGGYDLFMSQRDENGEWQEAVNLGYPLNTYGDEINLVVLNDATKAYMSAFRSDGFGGYDIYEFDLDEKFRPQSVEIVKPSVEEYYANALEKRETVVLKNIYFDFDSAELKPDSEEGIDAIYNFLNQNPNKKIMIEGHTDDIGSEEYNLELSKKRAESVKITLINKGISADRIKTKGCGSSQPLSTNNFDDELKTLNRRVSMSLID